MKQTKEHLDTIGGLFATVFSKTKYFKAHNENRLLLWCFEVTDTETSVCVFFFYYALLTGLKVGLMWGEKGGSSFKS